MRGRFFPICRFRIAASVHHHDAVAADRPVTGANLGRQRLSFRQAKGQAFAVAAMALLYGAFVKIRRLNSELDPRLRQHGPTNFAVAGQYQGHNLAGG